MASIYNFLPHLPACSNLLDRLFLFIRMFAIVEQVSTMHENMIDGKRIAEDILRDVSIVAPVMQKRVVFIQYGTDMASTQFIARKERVARQMGIQADIIHDGSIVTTEAALALLRDVIAQDYDGIVVQLPLPFGVDTDAVLAAIPVAQDIDVLGEMALQAFQRGITERMPPVAGAIDRIIRTKQIVLENKAIVLLGKGRLVGAPIALLFDRLGVPYTAIDIATPTDLCERALLTADIIISGIGVPGHITPDMVKEGVILLDAGTSENNGVLMGDVDPSCYQKAALYTPVPGGVGPITVAVLLNNMFV